MNISDSIITSTIQALIDNGLKKFMINFDARANFYHTEQEYRLPPRNIIFLINGTYNYISVWAFVQEYWNKDKPIKSYYELKDNDFNFLCCHDSCWRDSITSLINEQFFNMREALLEEIPDNIVKKTNIHEINRCVTLSPGLSWIKKCSFTSYKQKGEDYKLKVENFKIEE